MKKLTPVELYTDLNKCVRELGNEFNPNVHVTKSSLTKLIKLLIYSASRYVEMDLMVRLYEIKINKL